jgi:hypothetical protein
MEVTMGTQPPHPDPAFVFDLIWPNSVMPFLIHAEMAPFETFCPSALFQYRLGSTYMAGTDRGIFVQVGPVVFLGLLGSQDEL